MLSGRRRARGERLEACFVDHYVRLLRFAYIVSGSKAEAEDLVHDAFLRMWRVADRLQEDGMLAYARRTIVNLHRSSLRHLLRRRPPPTNNAVDEVDVAGRTDVRSALRQLTPAQRACLVLRFFEDMSVRTIAETLELSEDAVKKHLSRGMKRLRVVLSEEVVQ